MLIGSYHHTIEAKGRLAIPKLFRTHLPASKTILTRGIEPCLQLLPFNTWRKLTHQLGNNPLSGVISRQLRRLLAADATQVEFDSQGRILIPELLRQSAQIRKKVVVIGLIDWIEIWDRDIYADHAKSLHSQASDLEAKHLSSHHTQPPHKSESTS